MTRRHFERLAKAVAAAQLDDDTRERVVDQMALMCGEFNERFDYGRFADRVEELDAKYKAEPTMVPVF